MKVKRLITDDDAVSPVIGVILMVAITVILAAVIASFVLGLGNQTQQGGPTTTFKFDYSEVVENSQSGIPNAGIVKISHAGGDSIRYSNLYVRGQGINQSYDKASSGGPTSSACSNSGGKWTHCHDIVEWSDSKKPLHIKEPGVTWNASQTNGDDSHVVSSDYLNVPVDEDFELSLVYLTKEGDSSSTLVTESGPGA